MEPSGKRIRCKNRRVDSRGGRAWTSSGPEADCCSAREPSREDEAGSYVS